MTGEHIGPYRVEEVLGSGGMGTVYAAWDERLERRVAIKSLHPDRELSDERRQRLIREAKAAAGISHSSVAQVHDIVTVDERLYIVMELVEGRSLSDMVAEGPLELETALEVGRQIAEGLGAAHDKGVIHRDLKAQNVMVTGSGQVKILDFGLAKRLDRTDSEDPLTGEGMVVGTCHAMSPEQAEGRDLDHRSDLFALGSLLYRMLTGEHPFSTTSPLSTLRRVVGHTPDPVSSRNPAVPEPLGRLVERLLEKHPERRPPDAAVVADTLRVMADRSRATGQTATVIRPAHLSHRQRRRRRMLATVAAVLVVGLAVAAWLVWRSWPRTPLAVAVLAPEVVTPEGQEPALAGRAVREALIYTVAGLDGLAAIFPGAVDEVEGTPAEIALAVAADELVAATVEEEGSVTRVSLRRLDGADGSVLWTSGVFEVPAENLRLVADTVAANRRRGYPGLGPRKGAFVSEASPEDYARYLELSKQLTDPAAGVATLELLDDLAGIRASSPRLLEAYFLEVSHLRYLYQSTRRENLLDRARQVAAEASELAPDDPRALRSVVEVAVAAGDLDTADRVLERLEWLDPGSPVVLRHRATLLQRRGDFDGAIEVLKQRANSHPSWQSFGSLASVEMLQGRIVDARSHLEMGLGRAPRSNYLISTLAHLELSHGDPRRAEELYLDLVSRRGEVGDLANLGTARTLLGLHDLAAEAYLEALKVAPDHPILTLNLADSYSLQGRGDEAQGLYESTLQVIGPIEGMESEDLAVRALCLAHLDRRVEAAAAVSELLRTGTEAPEVLYDASLVYALIEERSSALALATRSLEAGIHPAWFGLPWFDSIRSDAQFSKRLSDASWRASDE